MNGHTSPEPPKFRRTRLITVFVITTVSIIVVRFLQQRTAEHEHRPTAVMGTACLLKAVGSKSQAEEALTRAESRLRRVEALMSTWLDHSEISNLNRTRAGTTVTLSRETVEVLMVARDVFKESDGVFDITCRPLVELWRHAHELEELPPRPEIDRARSASSWETIDLRDESVTKRLDTTRIDLGGIAKGYGIDAAIDAMMDSGCEGGLVEVGGDARCFGNSSEGDFWTIEIRHPSGTGILGSIRIAGAAVCSSGNYFRFFEIDGRRYSHIIDPRSGWPAEAAAAVTVVAPTAMLADAWATALSVLGKDGCKLLPAKITMEALIVEGEAPTFRLYATPGFQKLWIEKPAIEVVALPRGP